MAIPIPTRDPLLQHMFAYLNPRRDALPSHVVETIAGNLTFLVKYTGGPNVRASQISITVIDVRGPNNSEVGHKATVCIHEGPGKFVVVVWKQVEWGQNVVIGLGEKVDKAIKDILAKEGNDGYGDFKV
ncbi:uncharacterized protein ALTATR162_LOCUS10391 [Alternaria atra]|uniref:Uncharacterized protein n=1 Tax=Alternaria atra TaxID=119953 RepID=A0A8J2IFN1_9PLEO|nr:uncharacterized protein ALTATR162_LOCUS10391 [Alternaria atra]CAG5182901.1 unnamed protein product [Alternaria atra]